MLEFFKSNIFFNSLLLFPYALLIRVNNLISPIAVEPNDTYSNVANLIYSTFSNGIVQGILSTFFVYINALMINRLVIKHSITRESTLIPGLLYILLSAFMPEFLTLSPVLMGSTFIIIALYSVMLTYNQTSAAGDIFFAGFMVGLAGLIYFPFYFFYIIGFLTLLILKSFTFKDRLQYSIGFFTPTVLLLSWEVFVRAKARIIPDYIVNNFKLDFTLLIQDLKGLIVAGLITIFMGIVLFSYNRYMSQKATASQRKIDTLYWVALFSIVSILVTTGISYSHILILAFPVSIFLAMNFISFKNKIAAEVIHLFMIIFALMVQFRVVEL